MTYELRRLTILRFFLASWVVFYHYMGQVTPAGFAPLRAFVDHGYLAVDIFFVLSGFVLYHVYHRALENNSFNLRKFLIKRFARLYPIHFLTLFLCAGLYGVAWIVGIPTGSGPEDLYDIVPNLLLIHAWRPVFDLSLNYPSWSISAEWFAYILFPFLAILVSRVRPLFGLALSLAAFWGLVAVFCDNSVEQLHPLARVSSEFVIGLNLARLIVGRTANPTALTFSSVGSIATLLILPSTHYHDGVMVGVGILLLANLALLDFSRPLIYPNRSVFSALHLLGDASYSLYMLQAAIQLSFFGILSAVWNTDKSQLQTTFVLVPFALLVALSLVVYKQFERPSQRYVNDRLNRWSLAFAKQQTQRPQEK